MTLTLPDEMTIGEAYEPAMKITEPEKAREYFEALVERGMRFGQSRAESEAIIRSNLGYYAGYHSDETRRRVESLFSCHHPIFGSIEKNGPPTAREALEAGINAATTGRATRSGDA